MFQLLHSNKIDNLEAFKMVKAGDDTYYLANMRRDQILPYLEQVSDILINKIKKSHNYHYGRNTFHGRIKTNGYYDYNK